MLWMVPLLRAILRPHLCQVVLLVAVRFVSSAEDSCAFGNTSSRSGTALLQSSRANFSQVSLHENQQPPAVGSLNEVVGMDGVLVISANPVRFQSSAEKLKAANIIVTHFPATNAEGAAGASLEVISRGCLSVNDSKVSDTCNYKDLSRPGKFGNGCDDVREQGLADSHRRALEQAVVRKQEWTAIFEDDAVPVMPDEWDAAFWSIWSKLPPAIGLVRLGYCTLDKVMHKQPVANVHTKSLKFFLSDFIGYEGEGYWPMYCTHAYMVRRDIAKELVKLFPCCEGVDGCYLYDFLMQINPATQQFRGLEVMMSVDAWNSKEFIENASLGHPDRGLGQRGIIMQDESLGKQIHEAQIG